MSDGVFSRETQEKLSRYESLLLQWNQKINLIGPATAKDIWQRHFVDSAQLLEYIPQDTKTLLDVGTGAGFPGAILSLLGVPEVVLLEKSHKRCMFLRELRRTLDLSAQVECLPIEDFSPKPFDVVTSRACAPLKKLLNMCSSFFSSKTVVIFPKGEGYARELEAAEKEWMFHVKHFPSKMDCQAKILRLESIRKKSLTEKS